MTVEHHPSLRSSPTSEATGSLRRIVLGVACLGAAGLIAELLLIEHFESPWQLTPLILLGAFLAAAATVASRASGSALRVLRAVSGLCVVGGALGIYLHYRGNVEFELERTPGEHGLALFWEAVRGATPTLAAGALTQIGLLGLTYAFRHPGLRSGATVRAPRADTDQEIS